MPGWLARKGVWTVGAAVLLVIVVVAGLPLVASTQIIRDRIAYQMSAWSGYRVRLDDAPEIRIWPTFRAVLHEVTLLDWNETDPRTVLAAERIEMDLSALAALRGDVVFTKMRLIRPVLRLDARNDGLRLPTPQDWGRLTRSVEAARRAVSAAPSQPDTSTLPADTFGTVEISQGRIVADYGTEQTDLVTSLAGALDWPALNRQASLSASGIWHGENVALTASTAEPLILLGGGIAALNVSLQAAPGELSFEGSASLAGDNFVDGQFTVSAPSLARLAEWTHALSISTSRLGPVELTARVVGDARRLKFEDTVLGLDTSTGRGLLDVSFGEGGPLIAGTLAFDTLNLRALLNAFSPFSSSPIAVQEAQGPPSEGGDYDFDLRFSAVNATFGSVALTNVAAAAKMKDGLAAFDVSDATAFGGTLQFGLRADRAGENQTVELRMAGEEVDASQLAAALGYQRLVPQARSTFSLALKGAGEDLESVLRNADGTFSAVLGKGRVTGLSMEAFFERSAAGDFFPLSALQDGTLPIDGAELKAGIAGGVAHLENAVARSGPYVISFDGLVPFAGRALALYGTLAAPEGDDQRLASPLMFFVGGSWNAPFIASTVRRE